MPANWTGGAEWYGQDPVLAGLPTLREFTEAHGTRPGQEFLISATSSLGTQLPELREVRRELTDLAAERAILLAQVMQEETTLRAEQSRLDRNRAAVTVQRGKRALPKVTKAEKQVRAKLATLASQRAWLDGIVQHDREQAEIDNAIWNTAHDPETSGSDDW